MIAFFKKLFGTKVTDPEAVNEDTVKLYIKVHKRFDREYHSDSWHSLDSSRELYAQLTRIRATANRATNAKINQAFGLPENFLFDEPPARTTNRSLYPQ